MGWFGAWRFSGLARKLEKILEIDQGDHEARYFAGKLLLHLRRYKEALAHLAAVHVAIPDHRFAAFAAASAALELGEIRMAAGIARETLESNPEDGDLQWILGVAHLLSGELAEAESSFWAVSRCASVPANTGDLLEQIARVRSGAIQPPRSMNELFGPA